VSLANFYDTMIDYPQSKDYVMEVLNRLFKIGIIETEKQLEKYSKHLENLENDVDFEDY
jgi:hypothetical protein